jgi:hypothetical protein
MRSKLAGLAKPSSNKKGTPLGRRIGLSGVSGCRAGDVRWRDEKIEIALSRSSFSSQGNRLRCALAFRFQLSLRDIKELLFERG